MMNNLMGGRQGFYPDDNSRLGGGGGGPFSHSSSSSSSCSSSPTAEQHQLGFPLSYYSSYQPQPQPRGPTLRDIEMTRGYGGGRGSSSTSQLHHHHDHPMMISMDGSSSSPTATTTRCEDEGPSGGGGGGMMMEKEHMFDKVVTPSDVGKLNRLVIPKQHAEKYFPLDSSTNEKGLLLNFEDRNGKPWRFRYSYWNSSQSYVMTKGWSRFVKEKKLDAGDIVSFQRGMGEIGKDRLFIDWRRRPDAPSPPPPHQFSFQYPWNHPPPPPYYLPHYPPPSSNFQQSHLIHTRGWSSTRNPCPPIIYVNRSGAGREEEAMVFESVPVVQGKAAAKRLRLFGVNITEGEGEGEGEEEDQSHILSSTAVPTAASINLLQTMPSHDHHLLLNKPKPASASSMSLDLDI